MTDRGCGLNDGLGELVDDGLEHDVTFQSD